MSDAPKKKDVWDILQAVGSALVPVSVAVVGILGANFLDEKQSEDTKSRFYIELLSKREEADSALRKDMFNTFIQSFINPTFKDPETKVLGLELLEANFHESIDLSPLFRDLSTQLREHKGDASANLTDRLTRIAQEVKDKQVIALAGAGGMRIDMSLDDMSGLKAVDSGDSESVVILDADAELPGDPVSNTGPIPVHVWVGATAVDPETEQIHVTLTIATTADTPSLPKGTSIADSQFWLGRFDLPVLNNTRLTSDLRCAVVLNDFKAGRNAGMTLVIFPASRASTKDKPYLDEMIGRMVVNTRAKKPAAVDVPRVYSNPK